jgi:hypothetical protein
VSVFEIRSPLEFARLVWNPWIPCLWSVCPLAYVVVARNIERFEANGIRAFLEMEYTYSVTAICRFQRVNIFFKFDQMLV